MMQKDIMLQGEADAWFERNRDRLGLDDPVTHTIAAWIRRRPERVLEVGCANGWRLAKLRDLYGCEVYGVEPSRKAAMEAVTWRVPVYQMTATCLPVVEGGFDLIIYGFCLYLTDPKDWLQIAAEGDRALRPGGHIIIHDFGDWREFIDARARGVPYEHDRRITSWHFDWAQLWLAHPGYSVIHRGFTAGDGHPDQQAVTILRKSELKR